MKAEHPSLAALAILSWGLVLAGCAAPPVVSPLDRLALAMQRHERAAAAIERLGGRVTQVDPGAALTLRGLDAKSARRALAHAADLMDLSSVALIDVPRGEWSLADLGDPPRLRHVLLSGTAITEPDIAWLKGRPLLEELHLIDAALSDGMLADLAEPKLLDRRVETFQTLGGVKMVRYVKLSLSHLRVLRLVDEPITDEGLAVAAKLTSLRELKLAGTRATVAGAQRLVEAIPRLVVEIDGRIVRGADAER